MPRLTHPRNNPINIVHGSNTFIGYEVVLGDPDRAFAIWLVPNSDGELVNTRVEDPNPSATAMSNKVFNSTKDLIE